MGGYFKRDQDFCLYRFNYKLAYLFRSLLTIYNSCQKALFLCLIFPNDFATLFLIDYIINIAHYLIDTSFSPYI